MAYVNTIKERTCLDCKQSFITTNNSTICNGCGRRRWGYKKCSSCETDIDKRNTSGYCSSCKTSLRLQNSKLGVTDPRNSKGSVVFKSPSWWPNPGIMITYLLSEPGTRFFKVGRTMNIPQRLTQLQTGNPRNLDLFGWIEGDVEAQLHSLFSEFKVNREWFVLTDSELQLITGLRKD